MFRTYDLGSVDVPVDPIGRTMGHIMNYSERPTPCSIPVKRNHYCVDQQLSLHCWDREVLFSSGFSKTGGGTIRQLIPEEFVQAFDLPTFLEWEARLLSDIVPLQLYRVVIDVILAHLGTLDHPITKSQKLVSLEKGAETVVAIDAQWLPRKMASWLLDGCTDRRLGGLVR